MEDNESTDGPSFRKRLATGFKWRLWPALGALLLLPFGKWVEGKLGEPAIWKVVVIGVVAISLTIWACVLANRRR